MRWLCITALTKQLKRYQICVKVKLGNLTRFIEHSSYERSNTIVVNRREGSMNIIQADRLISETLTNTKNNDSF